jgi:hypothetical protein
MSKLKQYYSQQLIDIRYQSSWEDYDYQYSQWMARKNPPTGIMAKVRDFLIEKPVDGEDIINIVPKVHTVYPDREYSFNEISQNIQESLTK